MSSLFPLLLVSLSCLTSSGQLTTRLSFLMNLIPSVRDLYRHSIGCFLQHLLQTLLSVDSKQNQQEKNPKLSLLHNCSILLETMRPERIKTHLSRLKQPSPNVCVSVGSVSHLQHTAALQGNSSHAQESKIVSESCIPKLLFLPT